MESWVGLAGVGSERSGQVRIDAREGLDLANGLLVEVGSGLQC